MRASTLPRLRAALAVASSSLALNVVPVSGGEDPSRFLVVPEWRGFLRVSGQGSGSLDTSPGSSYRAHVSADLPLLLKGAPGAPINLQRGGCVANYVAQMESQLQTVCDSGTTEFTTTASAPFLDFGGGQCPSIVFSVDPFFTVTGSVSVPLLAFDGTERLISDCPDTVALSLLDDLLAKDPAQPVALAYQGTILELEGDVDGALDLYAQAIDLVLAADPDASEPPADLPPRHRALRAGRRQRRRRHRPLRCGGGPGPPLHGRGHPHLPRGGGRERRRRARHLRSHPHAGVFLGEAAPPAPFPDCAEDPAPGGIGCVGFGPCAD